MPPQDNQQAVWDETYEFRKGRYPRLVAEGDSWFAYPVWRNMVDFIGASNKFAICRRGESGRLLRQIVEDGRYLEAVKSERPKLVMISGSGNDFVNKRFVTGADGDGPIFNEYFDGMTADELINETKWQRRLDQLTDDFETIIKRLNGLPLITHGYDYILPSGIPAAYDGIHVAGPWIQPTMKARDIQDPGLQFKIVALMIDSLNDVMAGIANVHTPSFVHVDLRGTLGASDWANEIHPYAAGFKRLAGKYVAAVTDVLD